MPDSTTLDPLDPLRRATQRLHEAEVDRNRLLRSLRSQHTPITRLSQAADLSVGTVHRLTRPAVVVSIGYEGRSADDFIDTLVERGVGTLVDVRENAISRKRGFSKTALMASCEQHGIGYRHERDLGNPRTNRDGFRAGEPSSVSVYRQHLRSNGAPALGRVTELLKDQTVALLCFEAEECHCHRSIVVEQLKALDPLVTVQQA